MTGNELKGGVSEVLTAGVQDSTFSLSPEHVLAAVGAQGGRTLRYLCTVDSGRGLEE